MTDTLEPVAAAKEEVDQEQLAQRLLAQAKEQGVELVGTDGLLNQLTKRVLETALEEEMAEHLGYDKHDPGHPGIRRAGAILRRSQGPGRPLWATPLSQRDAVLPAR
jgi:mutator family transposase